MLFIRNTIGDGIERMILEVSTVLNGADKKAVRTDKAAKMISGFIGKSYHRPLRKIVASLRAEHSANEQTLNLNINRGLLRVKNLRNDDKNDFPKNSDFQTTNFKIFANRNNYPDCTK